MLTVAVIAVCGEPPLGYWQEWAADQGDYGESSFR